MSQRLNFASHYPRTHYYTPGGLGVLPRSRVGARPRAHSRLVLHLHQDLALLYASGGAAEAFCTHPKCSAPNCSTSFATVGTSGPQDTGSLPFFAPPTLIWLNWTSCFDLMISSGSPYTLTGPFLRRHVSVMPSQHSGCSLTNLA